MDLEIYAGEDGLKMNWLLEKPGSVSSIQLHWEGADRLEIDEAGDLLIHHAPGILTDLAPIAYQEIDGDGESLVYLTFLGNGSNDTGLDIAVDSQGTAYVTGQTNSTVLPTAPNAFQTTYPGGGSSGFITKFSSDGASLIYSTYLGGGSHDNCLGIVLDTQGYAYVTGTTHSPDFPVTPDAFQTTRGGFRNIKHL